MVWQQGFNARFLMSLLKLERARVYSSLGGYLYFGFCLSSFVGANDFHIDD